MLADMWTGAVALWPWLAVAACVALALWLFDTRKADEPATTAHLLGLAVLVALAAWAAFLGLAAMAVT